MDDVLKLFNYLHADKLSFLYNGFLHDEFTGKIIDLFEQNASINNESLSVKNKISFLVAESFQNIVRHGEMETTVNNTEKKSGVFILRNVESTFYITSANLVKNQKVDSLQSQLSQINNLDKDELKALHQELLNTTEFSEKGGAGLGLIQMANKSGQKLEYDFEKINNEQSFFYLQLKIRSKNVDETECDELSVSESKFIHEYMTRNNTYLAYKGNFSQENVIILLKIIERNLQVNQQEDKSTKTIIYNILTELLQNISKHGYLIQNSREGLFSIGKIGNSYTVTSGNYINKEKTTDIISYLEILNNMDKESLKSIYLNKIKKCEIDINGNAGLGFLEIARKCSNKIGYQISNINNEYSFLTLSIVV